MSEIDLKSLVVELNKQNTEQMKNFVSSVLSEIRRPVPENNKGGYEMVIMALQEAELPTDIRSLNDSLNKGIAAGAITDEDKALVQAYLAAHKTEIANFEQQMAERAQTAQAVLEKKANERWFQENGCTHEHPRSAGGGTHCVYVRDNDVPASPGFILCQRCQGRFRPDEPVMRKLDPSAIFSTAKFNTLMQDCLQTGAEILG